MVTSPGRKRRRCVVRAEAVDHPGRHVVDRDVGRDRRAAHGERLEDQRRVEPRQPRAADILADVDAAHAERRRLAHLRDREVLLLVPLDRVRREPLGANSRAMSRIAMWSGVSAKAVIRDRARCRPRSPASRGASRVERHQVENVVAERFVRGRRRQPQAFNGSPARRAPHTRACSQIGATRPKTCPLCSMHSPTA